MFARLAPRAQRIVSTQHVSRTLASTSAGANTKQFKIYRYNPDTEAEPSMQTYNVDLDSKLSRMRCLRLCSRVCLCD